MDYFIKSYQYQTAGVKEYWIVDPQKDKVMVYRFDQDDVNTYDFTDEIPVGIYEGDLKSEWNSGRAAAGSPCDIIFRRAPFFVKKC